MLFHYDGIVDEWRSFDWSNSVIHISALNQTKWYSFDLHLQRSCILGLHENSLDIFDCYENNRWFAKRFLHPDIVAVYSYIFLWDEDLGVENFNPERYVKVGILPPILFYLFVLHSSLSLFQKECLFPRMTCLRPQN